MHKIKLQIFVLCSSFMVCFYTTVILDEIFKMVKWKFYKIFEKEDKETPTKECIVWLCWPISVKPNQEIKSRSINTELVQDPKNKKCAL